MRTPKKIYAPQPSDLPTRRVSTNHALRACIREAMDEYGPACDLNHLDVSKIVTFESLFENMPFVGNIARWETSNVKTMMDAFLNCPFNGDISNWNTSACESMQSMFRGAKFSGDLSKWDTRQVLSMSNMFHDSEFNGSVANWKFERLLNIKYMFKDCPFNGDISSWQYLGRLDLCFAEAFATPTFQSDLPKFPVNMKHDRAAAFSPGYTGSLSDNYSLAEAAYLFESKPAFNQYLRDRAVAGLESLHLAKALASEKVCPRWLPRDVHAWLHQEKSMCISLGMDAQDTLAHVRAQYARRERGEQHVPDSIALPEDFGP